MSKNLVQFIIEEQRHAPGATGDFTGLLSDIIMACKQIAHSVNKGALIGVLGSAGSENIQGETQKKLDVITNEIFIEANGAVTWRPWHRKKWMTFIPFRHNTQEANTY